MRVTRLLVGTVALASGLSLVLATPAGAHTTTTTPSPVVLTTAVGTPFNLDYRNGKLLVADGGAGNGLGLIGRVQADGTVKTVVADVPGASGVATSTNGRYRAYTTTVGDQNGISASGLTITGPYGFKVAADTLAFETAKNPDGGVHYGVDNPSQCVSYALAAAGIEASYTGKIDSHAYSVASFGGRWVVADAGANALLWVKNSGKVSTLSVLPRQPLKITAEIAATFQLPDCVVGTVYNFEAVPTDVEVGGDGFLYVTTLPGGPEGPVLGARGKVYRVNPWNGHATVVARKLMSPTNLAIVGGKIYVAELFGDRISRIRHGLPSEFVTLPGALSVEAGPRGTLLAGTGVTGAASVVSISTKKGWKH